MSEVRAGYVKLKSVVQSTSGKKLVSQATETSATAEAGWEKRWLVLRSNGSLHMSQDWLAWPEMGRIDVLHDCEVGEWREVSMEKSCFQASGLLLETLT